MTMKISLGARTAACNAIVDLVDAGGAGTIEIRTGAPPSLPADADSGTLLATLTFTATAFGAASDGVATAAAITSDTNVDASNTAGHFRVKSGAGTVIFQGTVTATGNGGDMTFDSITFIAGGTAAISSFTVTVPA